MKVKISQLEPNPFRDMKNYPIDSAKIEALGRSIDQTGFWDNILARKHDGKIQIAYGHHRLVVLRKKFRSSDEVDIPVKSLDDATMLKIMANENMDEWAASVAVVNETVKVTKEFLEKNPGHIKTIRPIHFKKFLERAQEGYEYSPLAFQIHEFLNWPESRIYEALDALGMIKAGKLDKESLEKQPTVRAGSEFKETVKRLNLTIPEQKKLVQHLEKTGEKRMEDAAIEAIYPSKKKERAKEKLFETRVAEASRKIGDLILVLDGILREEGKFRSDFFKATIEAEVFVNEMTRLILTIQRFKKTKELTK